jgi:hypothetical protein
MTVTEIFEHKGVIVASSQCLIEFRNLKRKEKCTNYKYMRARYCWFKGLKLLTTLNIEVHDVIFINPETTGCTLDKQQISCTEMMIQVLLKHIKMESID